MLAAMVPHDASIDGDGDGDGGKMLTAAEVEAVHAAGGRLMMTPNCEPEGIGRAVALGMLAAPGAATGAGVFL